MKFVISLNFFQQKILLNFTKAVFTSYKNVKYNLIFFLHLTADWLAAFRSAGSTLWQCVSGHGGPSKPRRPGTSWNAFQFVCLFLCLFAACDAVGSIVQLEALVLPWGKGVAVWVCCTLLAFWAQSTWKIHLDKLNFTSWLVKSLFFFFFLKAALPKCRPFSTGLQCKASCDPKNLWYLADTPLFHWCLKWPARTSAGRVWSLTTAGPKGDIERLEEALAGGQGRLGLVCWPKHTWKKIPVKILIKSL